MHTCTQSVIWKVGEPQSIFLTQLCDQKFTYTISRDIIGQNVCFEDPELSVSMSYRLDNFEDSHWEQSHHHSCVPIPFHQWLNSFHYCLPPMQADY